MADPIYQLLSGSNPRRTSSASPEDWYKSGKAFGDRHFPRGQGSGSKDAYQLQRETLSLLRSGGHSNFAREFQRGVEDSVHGPHPSKKRHARDPRPRKRGKHAKARVSAAATRRRKTVRRRQRRGAPNLGRVQKHVYTRTHGGFWVKTPVYAGGKLAEYPYKLSNTRHKPWRRGDPLITKNRN